MTRAMICALLLCLPWSAAQAQNNTPSGSEIAALEACVDRVSRGAAQGQVIAACSGTLRGGCPETTTLDIADCLMAEAGAWDALLNRWWKPMRARAQANGTWDRLLAGQRAWIAEKEAACARAYDSAGGGSIRVIYAAQCQRDFAARKAVEFYYTLYR